jgi:hypothetical protein
MKPVLSVALVLATAQVLAGQEEEIKKALAGCAALGIGRASGPLSNLPVP